MTDVLQDGPGAAWKKCALEAMGVNLDKLAAIVSELVDINTSLLLAPEKCASGWPPRSLMCFRAVKKPGISRPVQCGEGLAAEKGYSLSEMSKLQK